MSNEIIMRTMFVISKANGYIRSEDHCIELSDDGYEVVYTEGALSLTADPGEDYYMTDDPTNAWQLAKSVIANQRQAAEARLVALARNEERLINYSFDQTISRKSKN